MNPRLKGQEISVRVVNDGVVAAEFDSIASFEDNTDIKEMEDGFLGEQVNRFDNALNGFGGGFEMQLTSANWLLLKQAVIAKAKRETPQVVFNVVVTDLFANGDSVITTYSDVTFGPIPKSVASRTDFVKVKWSFKCSQQGEQINALP